MTSSNGSLVRRNKFARIRNEAAGEVPKAFDIFRGEITPEAMMAFITERVAPHKKIRRVEFIEQMPLLVDSQDG